MIVLYITDGLSDNHRIINHHLLTFEDHPIFTVGTLLHDRDKVLHIASEHLTGAF